MTREQVRIETPRLPDMTDAQWEAAVAKALDDDIAFQKSRPSLADLLDFDGHAVASAVGKPALLLEAAEDWQVSPPQGRQLAQTMLAAGNPSVSYRFLPRVGHLMTANAPGVTDYDQLSDYAVVPELLQTVVGWVTGQKAPVLDPTKNPAR